MEQKINIRYITQKLGEGRVYFKGYVFIQLKVKLFIIKGKINNKMYCCEIWLQQEVGVNGGGRKGYVVL